MFRPCKFKKYKVERPAFCGICEHSMKLVNND